MVKAPIPSPIFKLPLSPLVPEIAKYDLLGTPKEPKGDCPFPNQLPGRALCTQFICEFTPSSSDLEGKYSHPHFFFLMRERGIGYLAAQEQKQEPTPLRLSDL